MAKILVTAALPYVNNTPHLGNIIGCVLSADVFARYCRLRGDETLFVGGTDEHGTATETQAIKEGLTPREVCDKYYAIHKSINEWLGCSFDCFGRTSAPIHHQITQDIFKQLDKNGYIKEGHLDQLHCDSCDRFLADRFVIGTCPHCNYDKANGDQCDSCGKLLDAATLKDPKCKLCSSTPTIKRTEHLFLDLPKLTSQLQPWTIEQGVVGKWTNNSNTITKAWFAEGLKEICITRDLNWGVKVPKKGYENKVFYVWFDAPIGYMSITAGIRDDWKDWWYKDAKIYNFIAKDNVAFHSIIFPGTLIGANRGATLVHHIDATEYLQYEGGKFSKSQNRGVFGDTAMNSGIVPDAWRYYLLSHRPETSDANFSWNEFGERYHNELLANLGNFVNRTLTFSTKNFGTIPTASKTAADQSYEKDVLTGVKEITKLLDEVKLRDGLFEIMKICKRSNQYFQEQEPWKLIKEDKERCGTVIHQCLQTVAILSILIEPYLPFSAQGINTQLKTEQHQWKDIGFEILKPGHELGKSHALYPKVDKKVIEKLKEQTRGKEEIGLDIRVAKVVESKIHPEADKLYIITVDLGESKRQIVSGLRDYYSAEELVGKTICLLANLAPAKIRGIKSQGMLLAADVGKNVVVVEPTGTLGERLKYGSVKPSKELTYKQFTEVKIEVKDGKVHADGKLLRGKKGPVAMDAPDGSKIR
jgi:methionyl-tRNA synthetase